MIMGEKELTFGIGNNCTLQCMIDTNLDGAIGGLAQQSRGDSVQVKQYHSSSSKQVPAMIIIFTLKGY